MASYTDLETLLPSPSVGDTVPAEWFDAVRDNFAMIFGIAAATVSTSQTTTSTTYTNLATVGPSVTVDTGTKALVVVTFEGFSSTVAAWNRMSYVVSGASSIAAADSRSAWFATPSGGGASVIGIGYHTNLTAGSNTFTAKYRVSAGTGTFANRNIFVIPLA